MTSVEILGQTPSQWRMIAKIIHGLELPQPKTIFDIHLQWDLLVRDCSSPDKILEMASAYIKGHDADVSYVGELLTDCFKGEIK